MTDRDACFVLGSTSSAHQLFAIAPHAPTAAPAATLKRDAEVARLTEEVLDLHEIGCLRVEPFEREPQTAHRAAQAVQ